MSPTKHGRHIGIMSASAEWRRPRCHTFCFQSIASEWMHQFHSNFTEGSSVIEYRSSLKGGGGNLQNFD